MQKAPRSCKHKRMCQVAVRNKAIKVSFDFCDLCPLSESQRYIENQPKFMKKVVKK